MRIAIPLLFGVALSSVVPNIQEALNLEDDHLLNSKRPLRFGDINFLHTTDTHGWLSGHKVQKTYSGDWGDFVSFSEHLRNLTAENGQDLILVDSGDRHDGNGLSDATSPNGLISTPIFKRQHYDIVSIGNHELYLWENTQQELDVLVPSLTDKYVCSNVEFLRDGKYYPIGLKYRYFTTPVQKKRILAFSFLFDFDRANDKTRVTPIEKVIGEDWFKTVLSHFPPREVDVILVVGHLPVDKNVGEVQILHQALRKQYPDLPIQYFGGHSHIRDFQVYDEKLTALQSGRFCETVGFLGLNTSSNSLDVKQRFFRSYIDFNVDSFQFHTGISSTEEFNTLNGLSIKDELITARKNLKLDIVIGNITKSNYYMDYVPLSHPQSIYNMLTSKVLPTLEPEQNKTELQTERMIIINTGSIRYDLYKGPYTVDSHFIVSPFQNDWVRLTVPKDVAKKIVPILNQRSYIVARLLPPHHRYLEEEDYGFDSSEFGTEDQSEIFSKKLSKGYVTEDDFGKDGDDTPHKAVKNFKITNVVASEQLDPDSKDSQVDVIFYSFLTKNVKGALKRLGYPSGEPELYSRKYLGMLLDDFAATNEL